MFELDVETAAAYFEERGVVPPGSATTVEPLGDVVSNRVVRVAWDDDCLVAKQPLANFAIGYDRPIRVERVHNEAAAMRAWAGVVEDLALPAAVPEVRFEDPEAHVVGFACVPDAATNWRAELLARRRVDRRVADVAGRLLGSVHAATLDDPALAERFRMSRAERRELCRLDVHHETVAERHPDVAGHVEAAADRVLGPGRALVHGDYCPKNVLVDRRRGTRLWIIDAEFAYWGPPAFDVAYMLNYLLLTAVALPDRRPALLDSARGFWLGYCESYGRGDETAVVAELPVRLLARVDGLSPVDWVDEDGAVTVRTAAKRIIADAATVPGAIGIVRDESDSA